MTKMIDTHFHSLGMAEKGLNVHSLLSEFFDSGLDCALDIGTDPGDTQQRREYLKDFPHIYFSAGLYPGECTGNIQEKLHRLKNDLAQPKVVAVGECGLDNHWNYGTKEQQEELFIGQLKLADQFDLPVIIHNRQADQQIIDILANHLPRRRGILHCFSSDAETAVKMVEMGFYISFCGNVTFKKSLALQQAAKAVPLDRILVETDSPYLSPVPKRGKLNHPGNVKHTYDFISSLLNISLQEFTETVHNNFYTLFEGKIEKRN